MNQQTQKNHLSVLLKIIFFLSILLMPVYAFCAQVTLGWTQNTEPDIAGYRIFCRQENNTYTFTRPLWVGLATRLVVKDLDDNKDYYFMVRSYNKSGIQSINSNEVRYHTPDIPAPPTDTNTDTPPDQNPTIPDSNSDTSPDPDSNTSSGGDDIACDLMVSSSTNRSNSVILEGQTVRGLIYVFTRSDMDMYRVSFYLDDPGMNKTPITIENRRPFDFAGTRNDGNAVAFNTAKLSDGPHKITARVNFNGSYIEVPTAEFTVTNHLPQEDPINDGVSSPVENSDSLYDVMISASPKRLNPKVLEGQTVKGAVYIFTRPDKGVSRVRFYLDDPKMKKAPIKVENYKPFDFAGTKGNSIAVAYNTTQLSDGPHEITVQINLKGNKIEVSNALFTVANYSSQNDQTNLTEKTVTALSESDIADQTDNDSDNIFVSNNTDYSENESAISILDEFASSLDNVKTVMMEDGQHLTAESSEGTKISKLEIKEKPSSSDIPSDDLEFTYGLVDLTIENVDAGGSVIVKLYLPEGSSPETYYKYGPTPDQQEDHWYEFMYDGETGAQIDENIITLHYVDGERGDDDISVRDNKIEDIGGPALKSSQAHIDTSAESIDNDADDKNGCFISSLSYSK